MDLNESTAGKSRGFLRLGRVFECTWAALRLAFAGVILPADGAEGWFLAMA